MNQDPGRYGILYLYAENQTGYQGADHCSEKASSPAALTSDCFSGQPKQQIIHQEIGPEYEIYVYLFIHALPPLIYLSFTLVSELIIGDRVREFCQNRAAWTKNFSGCFDIVSINARTEKDHQKLLNDLQKES